MHKSYMKVSRGLWSLDKGAGMIEINLLDGLVHELSNLFRDYELKAKNGMQKNVKVFAQYLPQPSNFEIVDSEIDGENLPEPIGYTEQDLDAYFPCIIVMLDGTEIKEEGTTDAYKIRVKIFVGVFDDDKNMQGYRDVLDIIEKTRQFLLSLKNRILLDRYQVLMPLSTELEIESTWPFYFGELSLNCETARPLMSYF